MGAAWNALGTVSIVLGFTILVPGLEFMTQPNRFGVGSQRFSNGCVMEIDHRVVSELMSSVDGCVARRCNPGTFCFRIFPRCQGQELAAAASSQWCMEPTPARGGGLLIGCIGLPFQLACVDFVWYVKQNITSKDIRSLLMGSASHHPQLAAVLAKADPTSTFYGV